MEMFYIAKYNSTDRSIGYNIAIGGNNHSASDETKKILSEKAKERYVDKTKNPMYGKKHSEDSLKKMSLCKVGKNNPMYGRHLSEESKRKQEETLKRNGSSKGHVWTDEEKERKSIQQKELCKIYINKKVKCIDDDLIFDTVTEAAKHYGVSVSTLSGMLHGCQKTCKGRVFVFVD